MDWFVHHRRRVPGPYSNQAAHDAFAFTGLVFGRFTPARGVTRSDIREWRREQGIAGDRDPRIPASRRRRHRRHPRRRELIARSLERVRQQVRRRWRG